MLGKALLKALNKSHSQIFPTDIRISPATIKLDISNPEDLRQILKIKPDIIIHLAAYTNVDACESDKINAYKINTLGTKNITSICEKLDIPILYISTDYIFDGTKPTPYLEWDKPNPTNIYGATKAEAEKYVLTLKKYWLVRTSALYGKGGKNFVDTILSKAKNIKRACSHSLKVVADQIGSPTYTLDLADAILKLIDTDYYGIYHITNSDCCSWYEFAKTALQFAKIKCEVIPISSAELNRPAMRPKNFRLLNFIWDNSIGKPLRPWYDALNEYIKNYW